MGSNTSLFLPGTRIIVNNEIEDTTIKPGSVGYVSHVFGVDRMFPNVAYLQVVFSKIGITGKQRIKVADISVPVLHGDVHGDNYPSEKRKNFVCISPNEEEACNVVDLKDMDFLTWAVAMSLFVYKSYNKVVSNAGNRHYREKVKKVWPSSPNSDLNKLLNVSTLSQKTLDSESTSISITYSSPEVRNDIVNSLRMAEASLRTSFTSYLNVLSNLQHSAEDFNSRTNTKK